MIKMVKVNRVNKVNATRTAIEVAHYWVLNIQTALWAVFSLPMATKSARNLRSPQSLTSTRPTDGAGAAGGAGAALWTGAKPSTPCS